MQVTLTHPLQELSCNPYAAEYMLGIDPETPDGYLDLYSEYAFSQTVTAGQVTEPTLTFAVDFIVRALRANTNQVGSALPEYFIRLRDVDNTYISNAPVAASILFGSGQCPNPWIDWFIPSGFSIGLETTVSSGGGGSFQLQFVGVERRKMTK